MAAFPYKSKVFVLRDVDTAGFGVDHRISANVRGRNFGRSSERVFGDRTVGGFEQFDSGAISGRSCFRPDLGTLARLPSDAFSGTIQKKGAVFHRSFRGETR